MSERILVVDDEEVNRELVEAILSQDGFEVELAADGPEALARATANPPDLILLDVLMPGMTGLEACRRLKQTPATQAVPIIIVTAVAQVATKEAALTSGADDFMTKPIRPDDLRARVVAMLKVRRIHQELDRTLTYLHELEAVRHAQRQAVLDQVVAEPRPITPQPTQPIPILLVDDEALTRDFYGDLLVEHGFRVFAASSGPEGLTLARQHAPEVVILDIMMPDMSGLEVLERLREEHPNVPVIMLTGRPTSQNAIASLKLGAFDFIVKGLNHSLVVMAVHRAVRYRRETLQQQAAVQRLQARIADLEKTVAQA
ncbi:MAG TPA: response regulator [Candidatus Methylomirabilis sp.]|nr:response regulator [Candidatus Methylomirabilis sp.]